MSRELKTSYPSSLESETYIPSPRRFSCSSQFLASSLSQYKHKTSLNYDQTSCQDLSKDQHQDHFKDHIQNDSEDPLLNLNLMQEQPQDQPKDQPEDNTQQHIKDHCQDHPQCNPQTQSQDHPQYYTQIQPQDHLLNHHRECIQIISKNHLQNNIQGFPLDRIENRPQDDLFDHNQDQLHFPKDHLQVHHQDHSKDHHQYHSQEHNQDHSQNHHQDHSQDHSQMHHSIHFQDNPQCYSKGPHLNLSKYLQKLSLDNSSDLESDQNKYPHLCHPSQCRYHFNPQDDLQDRPKNRIQDYQENAQGLCMNINQESFSFCSSDEEKISEDHQDQQSNQLSDNLKDHQLIPLTYDQLHQHLNDPCENFPDFQDQQFDQNQKQKKHNHHFQERLSDQNLDPLFGNILDHNNKELTLSPDSLHDLCEAVPENICPEDHSTKNLRCHLNSWLTSSDQMLDAELDSSFARCTCIYKASEKEMIADKSTMDRKKSFFFRNNSCQKSLKNWSELQADSHDIPRVKPNYSNKTLEKKVRSWSSNLMCTCDDILTCTCQPHFKCSCTQEPCDVQDELMGVIELKTGVYLS